MWPSEIYRFAVSEIYRIAVMTAVAKSAKNHPSFDGPSSSGVLAVLCGILLVELLGVYNLAATLISQAWIEERKEKKEREWGAG